MNLLLFSCYVFFVCIVLFILVSLLFFGSIEWFWLFIFLGVVLSLFGLFDLIQMFYVVCCNYLILGNICYLVEGICLEICQYLLEVDGDVLFFFCVQCLLVYLWVKNESLEKFFGILIDVYIVGYEFISYLMCLVLFSDFCEFCVDIGGL